MKRLQLKRHWYDDERTIGELYCGSQWVSYTMEPGRLDVDHPRVPADFYLLERHGWEDNTRLRFKRTWALVGRGVSHQPEPDIKRFGCVIHGGSRDEHTDGCVLLGMSIGRSRDEPSVGGYEEAMIRLQNFIGDADALLLIEG
jgi:hypothetical protein